MGPEDAMPVGDCVVCNAPLDHSDAGFCKRCGGAFCWSRCGGWYGDEHECDNCNESDDDTDD